MNYASLAFSDATKILQEEAGTRNHYAKVEKVNVVEGLSENEILFISQQDHFYIASFGDNGFPYIQHRGGPPGFVKVLDNKTIAFVDFVGNKQYISVGNIETHPNVALIMVSYPHKARLKIYATAKVVALEDDPALFESIDPANYQHRPERMMVLKIQAYDWNCPQHITPRYTADEVEQAFTTQRRHMENLEAENKQLREEIAKSKSERQKNQ